MKFSSVSCFLIALIFTLISVQAPAAGSLCLSLYSVSNNLTLSEVQLKKEIESIALYPELLTPLEAQLKPQQKKLIRTLALEMILYPIKGFKKLLKKPQEEFKDITEQESTKLESTFFSFMASLVENRQLKLYFNRLLDLALKLPLLSKKLKPQESFLRGYAVAGGIDAISAIVEINGMSSKSKDYLDKNNYRQLSWAEFAQNSKKKLGSSQLRLSHPYFMGELLGLAQTHYAEASKVELLIDGPQSFKKRDTLIDGAEKSIEAMSWAVLDDMTGADFTRRLIEKAKAGIKVRLMVDGKVSTYHGYGERIKEMEEAGIEIVRWYHTELSYLIQHRKILFVDGKSYIAGGINVGDSYSHKNPDLKISRWRDTDIYVEGPAVKQAYRLFTSLWNQQLVWFPMRNKKATFADRRDADISLLQHSEEKIPVALVESLPGPWNKAATPIMLSLMKAIRGAEKTIDIENAYVVMNSALRQEIRDAIQRGVKVRVLTNADSSVDEAVVALPIMKSAKELAKMGAQVFLKKGGTLHSKVMVVDERLSFVKSYNFHPRSERIDGEVAFIVDHIGFAKQVTAMFNQDIAPENATAIKSHEEIKYQETLLDRLLLFLSLRLGYDVL